VFVLHIAIIGGAFLVMLLGSHAPMLVVLVLLKTGMDLYTHSRAHRRAQAEERRKLDAAFRLFEAFRRGDTAADAEGGANDSLQARFPGYVRDRQAETWRRRPAAWLTLGGVGALAVGILLVIAEVFVPGGVLAGAGLVAFITGVVLYNMRRRLPCSVCGRRMEIVETGVTPAEMTPAERFATLRGTARARQRWLVCHPCKRYWQAWRSVQGADD
jgi:hypothetical protein